MRDLNKFIIGVIQDYCNKRGLTFESERFALTFGSVCANQINNNLLSVDSVILALKNTNHLLKGIIYPRSNLRLKSCRRFVQTVITYRQNKNFIQQ